MKIFVSYTSADRQWAHWIAWQLRQVGHEPFVHEWEIGAGENIPRWMEERIDQADHLIGVFSDKYCEAIFSRGERWAAYWDDPEGRIGFLIPIEVVRVTKWPRLVSPLNRLSLINLNESAAAERLKAFLEPPKPPTQKPEFPGHGPAEPAKIPFTDNSEPLGSHPPIYPVASSTEERSLQLTIPVTSNATGPDFRCIDDHEPRPEIFGRDGEVETVVKALLEGKTILVAGGPGMGKTAIATVAFYDQRIVAHFGRRRVFASLETATEPRAILVKLVESLGLPPTGDEATLLRILQVKAAEEAFAAILDNSETVFEVDRSTSERILNLVAQIKGISLLVTIRGAPPHVPGAIHIDDLPKLEEDAAREAFLAIAGNSFSDDPNLPNILHVLDGHALSIHLVAAQAIGLPSLAGLQETWDEAHAEILRMSGEEESRLTSVRASLALSLNSKRMKATPLARRLLAMLALLPGGLSEIDARSLLGQRGVVTKVRANEAVVCLHQLRLVEKRPDRRLRMLTPLRECVRSDLQPMADDIKRIVDHYLVLAAIAAKIGKSDWEEYGPKVQAEVDNLDSICRLAVATDMSNRYLADALAGIESLYVFSGRGETRSIEDAAARFRGRPPTLFGATCIRWLAGIARERSEFETASANYKEALPLYKHLKSVLGQANCLRGLAVVANDLSDVSLARRYSEEALTLYRRINDAMGEANCVAHLGHIDCDHRDLQSADVHFNDALVLFQKIRNLVGEANCIQAFGDIARARSDLHAACVHYEHALSLHLRIGAARNQANCIKRLGDIARIHSDRDAARGRYEEALALYRSAGDVNGEAEVTIRLGQLQQIDSTAAPGLTTIQTGFSLYFEISNLQNRALPGWQAIHRGLTCGDANDAKKHLEQARSSWTAIGRLDLISEWIDGR